MPLRRLAVRLYVNARVPRPLALPLAFTLRSIAAVRHAVFMAVRAAWGQVARTLGIAKTAVLLKPVPMDPHKERPKRSLPAATPNFGKRVPKDSDLGAGSITSGQSSAGGWGGGGKGGGGGSSALGPRSTASTPAPSMAAPGAGEARLAAGSRTGLLQTPGPASSALLGVAPSSIRSPAVGVDMAPSSAALEMVSSFAPQASTAPLLQPSVPLRAALEMVSPIAPQASTASLLQPGSPSPGSPVGPQTSTLPLLQPASSSSAPAPALPAPVGGGRAGGLLASWRRQGSGAGSRGSSSRFAEAGGAGAGAEGAGAGAGAAPAAAPAPAPTPMPSWPFGPLGRYAAGLGSRRRAATGAAATQAAGAGQAAAGAQAQAAAGGQAGGSGAGMVGSGAGPAAVEAVEQAPAAGSGAAPAPAGPLGRYAGGMGLWQRRMRW
jgi:hypothetical protein